MWAWDREVEGSPTALLGTLQGDMGRAAQSTLLLSCRLNAALSRPAQRGIGLAQAEPTRPTVNAHGSRTQEHLSVSPSRTPTSPGALCERSPRSLLSGTANRGRSRVRSASGPFGLLSPTFSATERLSLRLFSASRVFPFAPSPALPPIAAAWAFPQRRVERICPKTSPIGQDGGGARRPGLHLAARPRPRASIRHPVLVCVRAPGPSERLAEGLRRSDPPVTQLGHHAARGWGLSDARRLAWPRLPGGVCSRRAVLAGGQGVPWLRGQRAQLRLGAARSRQQHLLGRRRAAGPAAGRHFCEVGWCF